jgi:hypothetical protein
VLAAALSSTFMEHETAAAVIGRVALIGGLLGAAINSVRPRVEYGVDLMKAAQFEHLYWDIFYYAMARLAFDQPMIAAPTLNGFARRIEEIAVISRQNHDGCSAGDFMARLPSAPKRMVPFFEGPSTGSARPTLCRQQTKAQMAI